MTVKQIRIIIIGTWVLLFLHLVGVPVSFLMINNNTFEWFGGMPSLEDLEKPNPNFSSELLSADGVILGKYFRKNRTQIKYNQLSEKLVHTLLVTEDIRFESHSGIDFKGLVRAVIGQLTFSFKGGGSTITMQLAENLFKTNSDKMKGAFHKVKFLGDIVTKLKEWTIAIELEKSYTKEEILALYLNTIEFGSNSYGIKVAAKTFFDKQPNELNYSESAVLVGIINAPTRWSPVLNPENAEKKRKEVLWNLVKYYIIKKEFFDTIISKPIALSYLVDNQNTGAAPYFRNVLKTFLINWSKKNGYDLFEDGLKIYTTIDSKLQKYAEDALKEHIRDLQIHFNHHWKGRNPWIDDDNNEIEGFLEQQIKKTLTYKQLKNTFPNNKDSIDFQLNKKRKMRVFSWTGEKDTLFNSYDSLAYYKHFLQAGFMAMEPQSGEIKAWVGGINYKYFKFDHVFQGKRQPGSVFKPIVYAKAIQNNFSPCLTAVDVPITIELPNQDPPTWSPENANGKFSGRVMTIREAMSKSVNSITAWVMHQVGPKNVVDMAKDLGIKSQLEPVYSLSLGSGGDVSLYEMIGAYSVFANKGNHIEPFYITKIEDKHGNIIKKFVPIEKEVINEETAYVMLHMLKGTVELGTGRSINYDLKINNDIGAKTGTTQNASDGWFIGVTKNLVAGAWVGGDNRSIRFRNWTFGQGGRTALPIWEKFMEKIYSDKSLKYKKDFFEKPLNNLSIELDCEKYNLTNSNELNKKYNLHDNISPDDF